MPNYEMYSIKWAGKNRFHNSWQRLFAIFTECVQNSFLLLLDTNSCGCPIKGGPTRKKCFMPPYMLQNTDRWNETTFSIFFLSLHQLWLIGGQHCVLNCLWSDKWGDLFAWAVLWTLVKVAALSSANVHTVSSGKKMQSRIVSTSLSSWSKQTSSQAMKLR